MWCGMTASRVRQGSVHRNLFQILWSIFKRWFLKQCLEKKPCREIVFCPSRTTRHLASYPGLEVRDKDSNRRCRYWLMWFGMETAAYNWWLVDGHLGSDLDCQKKLRFLGGEANMSWHMKDSIANGTMFPDSTYIEHVNVVANRWNALVNFCKINMVNYERRSTLFDEVSGTPMS